MFNLLAILLSFAMMLTGATAPADGAADFTARTLTLSNFSMLYNDQEVVLNPSVSFGVMTDGAQSVFDFSINSGGERVLPFQMVADDSGIVVLNDTSDTSLRVTAEEIDTLINSQLEDALRFDDEESEKVFHLLFDDLLPAYGKLIALARDPAQSKALQAEAERIYDEMVDRGEGVVSEMEYDGEMVGMTTYNYSLTGIDLGRIADAMFARNEVLSDFYAAYFKMFGMFGEESGLADVDSFEALYGKIEMMMDVTESVTETRFTYEDIVIRLIAPGTDEPLEIIVNSVKQEGSQSAEASFEVTDGDVTFEFYMESNQEGENLNGMVIISGNDEVEADKTDADDAEDYGDPDEDEVEDEPSGEPSDVDYGENEDVSMLLASESMEADTPEEDDFYFTVDFYNEKNEDSNGYGMSWSLSVPDEISLSFDTEGLGYPDGSSDNRFGMYVESDGDTVDISFDAHIGTEPFEIRADAGDACSLQELNTMALLTGLQSDLTKLTAEESVTRLVAMLGGGDDADGAGDGPVDDPTFEEGSDAPTGEDASGRSAEPYDDGQLSFGMPQFGWLPEGYRIGSIDVDTQYNSVNYEIENESGDSIYAYFNTSYISGELANYVLDEDGGTAVDGRLVTVERDGISRRFSTDDGSVAISLYSYGDELTDEEILRMIAGIQF